MKISRKGDFVDVVFEKFEKGFGAPTSHFPIVFLLLCELSHQIMCVKNERGKKRQEKGMRESAGALSINLHDKRIFKGDLTHSSSD